MLDYENIEKIKDEAKGKTHWFDADTMRFFKSRVDSVAYVVCDVNGIKYAYFTSSEKGPDMPRRYSVNVLVMLPGASNWQTEKVGEFQQYATKRAADKVTVQSAKEHDALTGAKDYATFHAAHVALRDANRAAGL